MLWELLSTSPPPTQSPDFFSSPIWQFLSGAGAIVAIPIAIIATITAILAYNRQFRLKAISYQIVSDAPIVSVNKALENRIQILLDGEPVKDASLLVIRVWNSGKAAIRPADYFEPIQFGFMRTVISSDILETEPHNLLDTQAKKSFLKHERFSSKIELNNFPLNPNDSVSFTVLLKEEEDFIDHIFVSGRIEQGKIINYDDVKYGSRFKYIYIFGIIIFVLMIFSTVLALYNSTYIKFSTIASILTIPFLAYVIWMYRRMTEKKRKRRRIL